MLKMKDIACSICGSGPGEGSIPGMENSIILSHWGMKSREIQCGWKEKIDFFGRCRHRQFAEQLLDIRRFRQCYIPGKVNKACTKYEI